MILLHRISPFTLGLLLAASFSLLVYFPALALQIMAVSLLLTALVLARMNNWRVKTYEFWSFLGTPWLLVASSFGMFLFFEYSLAKIALAIIVSLGVFLYAEHLFSFVHLPATYRPNSLEHLSLLVNVLVVFLLSATFFGLVLFLQVSPWLLVWAYLALNFFVVYNILWVSKIEHSRALAYALGGAVIMSEFFVALVYLPDSFYSSAAVLATFFYVYQGICRAHLLEKLSRPVAFRYLTLGIILLALVFTSGQWKWL